MLVIVHVKNTDQLFKSVLEFGIKVFQFKAPVILYIPVVLKFKPEINLNTLQNYFLHVSIF